jgi:hypothetical protein
MNWFQPAFVKMIWKRKRKGKGQYKTQGVIVFKRLDRIYRATEAGPG